MITILVSTLTFFLEPNSTPFTSKEAINQILCLCACGCALYPYVCEGTHVYTFFLETEGTQPMSIVLYHIFEQFVSLKM